MTLSQNPKVVFMGTPEFAAIILRKMLSQNIEVKAVVAQPDKPVGRGQKMASPPVAVVARENNITLFQPSRVLETDFLKAIEEIKPDIIVVAAYGKILPQVFLDLATVDCVNIHASLLPKWRGAAPINYALMQGDKKTGVGLMSMVLELDAGPVYCERELEILDSDDVNSLTQKLAHLGADLVCESLNDVYKKTIVPTPQNNALASYASKLSKEMSNIDWSKNALDIFNQVRGLSGWPVAQTFFNGKRVKIHRALKTSESLKNKAGKIIQIGKQGIRVATGDGDIILTEIQLEGKPRLSAFDVANGLRMQVGDFFGENYDK